MVDATDEALIAVSVRNTFLDVSIEDTLERWFSRQRRARSCPASSPARCCDLGREDTSAEAPRFPAGMDAKRAQNIGSERHGNRRCKPCAFFHSDKGCHTGMGCTFCHLCEPGEKKRRLKERFRKRREKEKLEQQLQQARPAVAASCRRPRSLGKAAWPNRMCGGRYDGHSF